MRRLLIAAYLLAALVPCTLFAQGRSPDRISAEEIRVSAAANTHDLVRALRPAWLRKALPGVTDPIVVYLGGARIGGPEALHTLPTAGVASISYLDPGAAQYRFGTGHGNGVIQISMEADALEPSTAPTSHSGRSRPALALTAGVPRPLGEGSFPDFHTPGPSMAVTYTHPLAPGFDLRVAVDRHQFRRVGDGSDLDWRERVSWWYHAAVEGGDITVTGISLGARVHWGSRWGLTPYFTGSVGRYWTEVAELRGRTETRQPPLDAERITGVGIAASAGVEMHSGSWVRLLAEAGFTNVNADGAALSFTPLRLGVSVPLTR
jgi:hypothetical protein